MTTAPALKSSRDRSTIRPVGVPPSSKTRNALYGFISYQLPPEGPGYDFRRALEALEIEAVHAVDDSRVGARGGFEPGPRHGLRRLAIGVEVHHSTFDLPYGHGRSPRLGHGCDRRVARRGSAGTAHRAAARRSADASRHRVRLATHDRSDRRAESPDRRRGRADRVRRGHGLPAIRAGGAERADRVADAR